MIAAPIHADGKACKKFSYIPLIPRLVAFAGNHSMATKMQYRESGHKYTPGIKTYIFNGRNYQSLHKQRIELGGKHLDQKYFADGRDVALCLSTDGFAPFKQRKDTAWGSMATRHFQP
jgi:hypothetical protein